MKTKACLIFINVVLSLFATEVQAAEVLQLRSDLWCPFTCEPKSDKPGILVEVAEAIFKEKGIQINYQLTNWAKSIELARKGEIDGIVGASPTEAQDLIFPKLPQAVVFNVYYKNAKNDFVFKGKESLKNRKIAVIKGYFYDDANMHLQKQMKSSFVFLSGDDPQEQMIKMLQSNRIDAAIESTAVFNWNLARLKVPADTIVSAGVSDPKPMELYLAFNPKSPKAASWAEILNDGMTRLRKSGELSKIFAKYEFQDWVK